MDSLLSERVDDIRSDLFNAAWKIRKIFEMSEITDEQRSELEQVLRKLWEVKKSIQSLLA